MALIRDRKLASDSWQLLEVGEDGTVGPIPLLDDVIVPVAAWELQRGELVNRVGRVGVWLSGDDDPARVAGDLRYFSLIAVKFAAFTDGRGYSIGRLLRQRYGWRGELRAIGDVQRDQLYYLSRCGFDAFVLRSAEDEASALSAFHDFTEPYQAAADQPLPLFRRRETVTG
jgi:uncharacterized protein (DUF934 family)